MAYITPTNAALGDKIGIDEWNQYVVENVKALKTQVDAILPVGIMIPISHGSYPTGWLVCAGQAVSRTTYAALFAVINTAYGTGDGSTTFNLPDLRGRMAMGLDNMGGVSANRVTAAAADGVGLAFAGGAENHTLSVAEMPSHSHPYQTGNGTPESRQVPTPGPNAGVGIDSSGTNFIKATGGGGAHNNMPPYLSVVYIIKY